MNSRSVQLAKIECDWCYGTPAAWKITDEFGYSNNACTVHGTEWFPDVFPESDTTPIESIIAEITGRVSLVKSDHDGYVPEWIMAKRRLSRTVRPWYPLVGHRDGLRANDLISLASALFVLALEGGTAYGPGSPSVYL